jgi:hypothetical protein
VLAVSDIQDMSEDLCDGQALPLVVGLLDPRPQGSGPELRSLDDPGVIQLAARTHSAAATRAAEVPLPSMGRFNSSAELSSMAALTLQAVAASPRGWKALSQAGFYTLVGDLLKEGIIPRPAIIIVGDIFRREGVQDQQRLDLARKFLGLGFLQYLLDRIDGTVGYCSCIIVQDPMHALGWKVPLERLTWAFQDHQMFSDSQLFQPKVRISMQQSSIVSTLTAPIDMSVTCAEKGVGAIFMACQRDNIETSVMALRGIWRIPTRYIQNVYDICVGGRPGRCSFHCCLLYCQALI